MRALVAIGMVLLVSVAPAGASVSGNIAALQVALLAAGDYHGFVDGLRGPQTTAATRGFQARHHLVSDGIAGRATRRALGRWGRHRWGSRTVVSGESGWDVARLQFEVARHGFPNGDEDGVFGPHALVGVQRFQAWAGLAADGAVGPSTRRALATPPPQSPLKFYRPLHVALGDPFGPRGAGFHPGIDLPAPTGTPVGAAGRGCVTFAGYDPSGYGNLVVIGHRLGVTSMYAHLSEIDVRVGQCLVGHDTQ